MDKLFDNFYHYAGFGPALQRRDVPTQTLSKYRGKLPNKLLEYWEEYGWCGYGKGLFWTVNPEEWEEELEAWIGETPFMEQDAYHVIARGAFGDLFLWGEKTGPSLHVCPSWGFIYPTFKPDAIARRGMDFSLQLFFSVKSRKAIDLIDENQSLLFERALAHLGPLDHETLYGFEPVLAFSGRPRLESLRKFDAHTHMNILAQMTPIRIMQDIVAIARNLDL